jgi:hypothetical protein
MSAQFIPTRLRERPVPVKGLQRQTDDDLPNRPFHPTLCRAEACSRG